MNKFTVIRRSVEYLYKYGKTSFSSLAEFDKQIQYPLPLILLPSASRPLLSHDFGLSVSKNIALYNTENSASSSAIFCHADETLKIKDRDQHVTSKSLISNCKVRSSVLLRNGVEQTNPEPPKPEKSKWEEEQYPDIGKSILLRHIVFSL